MKELVGIILITLLCAFAAKAQDTKKAKVVYKYKQYEKFDFDELSVTGEGGSPGDLSVTPRGKKSFENRLPYRKDFTPEIRKSTDRIR